jgi:serine/threonine protein kinase
LVGTPISHYRIVRQLGVGGMGVVYEAEDTPLGRKRGREVPLAELAKDAPMLERFERERERPRP